MEFTHQIIFLGGMLFITSILATVITPRLGVPLLLVFLVVGMLAGEDGPGGVRFGDFGLANLAATAALSVVLFDGGMRTKLQMFRVGLWPAISLSTLGVLVTAGITGVFAAWLLDLSLVEGLLIGAIVGSTDAAAVFSLLHTSAVRLNERVTSILEIESGANDPMAVFLTLAVLQYLLAPQDYDAFDSVVLFMQQMGLGALIGIGGGRALVWAINRLELSESLYPLLAFFGGLLIFGVAGLVHGSGFLAAYLAGLVVGNQRTRAFAGIRRFHDGVAWMAQIGMFVGLGLLVSPHKLLPIADEGLLIAAVLIVLARPAAVLLSLLPFRLPWREQIFMSWVGLRGSVPIVLATFPWLAGLDNAALYFYIAFFIVLVSLVVQGWTLAPTARLLGLELPMQGSLVNRLDFDLPGTRGYEIVSYRIGESSPLIGLKSGQLPIDDVSRIVCIARRGRIISYREWGHLRAGDYISLLAGQDELPKLDELFQSQAPPQAVAAEQRFYGEFRIDPGAPAQALADCYGVHLPESAREKSVSAFFASVVPRPVVGDRLRLGEMELVIRRMEGQRLEEIWLRLPH
ncbi:MAG: potassium/proton antiporter [Panacagrimonas sp.]